MKKNVGKTDRIIRLLIAAIAAILYATNVVTGTAAIVTLVVGGIMLLTSLISFCPLFMLFGISSCKVK